MVDTVVAVAAAVAVGVVAVAPRWGTPVSICSRPSAEARRERVRVVVSSAARRGGEREDRVEGQEEEAAKQQRLVASSSLTVAKLGLGRAWHALLLPLPPPLSPPQSPPPPAEPVDRKAPLHLPEPRPLPALTPPKLLLLPWDLADSGAVLIGRRSSARLNSMPAFPSREGATTEDDLAFTDIESAVCLGGLEDSGAGLGVSILRAERLRMIRGDCFGGWLPASGGGVMGQVGVPAVERGQGRSHAGKKGKRGRVCERG